ncbi:MAG: MGDG synthase family glycosyltransferase, partial [Candidatus Saccharimonadales bacterium]
MPRRVLVLSASVGAGHLRAAQAVELALRELAPDAVVQNTDVLELTNASFRRLYGKAYLDLVNRVPYVLGYFYDLMDRARSPERKTDRLRVLVEKLNFRSLLKLLRSQPWDVIVNTHFLPAELVASLRSRGEVATPHFTVTTDFETHRLWVNQPCERYFTATDEGAAYLAHWGVPAGDVRITGIPIHPAFSRPKERAECIVRHGLAADRPILLQLAGGFGVGPVAELYRAMLAIETPLQVVVVAGRNEALRLQLEMIEPPERHLVKVLGFTDRMDELMTAADLVLTKPGGLTTSEALASGAALAIINPIPGQESRNSDFLLENGAAVKINNIGTLGHKLTALLTDRARLDSLRDNARRLGRPRAAFDIAQQALAPR